MLKIHDFERTRSIYEQIPDQFNLAEYLLLRNSHQPHKTAFYHARRSLSYGELQQLVPKFAGMLQASGCRREERVVILLPDSPEFVVAYLGALWNGNIAVLVNEAVALTDIAYMIDNSRASIMISTTSWKEKLNGFDLHNLKTWVLIEDNLLDGLSNHLGTEACATSKDEPAFWAYTSGSTGRPKGVIHAHYSPIVACVRYASATLGLTERDIIYSAPPMAFTYGLGTSLYMPMFIGASSVLAETTETFGYIEMIHQFNPTVFFGIPNTYATILAVEGISPLNATTLRLCISAGEQLPPVVSKKWHEKFNLAICEGIGTTESTHIFISNRPDDCVPGSTGKPVEGYTITLNNGLLQITGEGMMLGYWNRLPETQDALHGNTLITADLYEHDAQGNYFFLGRKDDLLKVGGMWIASNTIEHAIVSLPGIKEAAIIVIPSRIIPNTQELACYLVMEEPTDPRAELITKLKRHLNQLFKRYQIPKFFYFMPILPRTSTGKIDRRALQALYKQQSEVSTCN